MRKLVILVQCVTLIFRGLSQGAPLRPDETWKSLDNPRNREMFFRTLKAYVSGKDLNLLKFPDGFSVNDKPKPVAFHLDPVASAYADFEEQKNSLTHYLKN
ncbi:uncharacterized protein C2orf66 homolog [Anolis carolinensis]|uniref:uncharacterized protein C2orf66 homolog n=1 Tax=Anolis carolinensis TaxID=28377 RepID=UPI000203A44B|nr:PREDICTED: uncharacterized protein C2orf66 homolog [Anolis carolinensis]XP_008115477.1 PREDICTED: uncharacterized protein C2orf66 homolog [Anolis carolinensis]|eukprot:XP_008115476.1 PREDICTED: uncharacterized protein C2orf66 homolog [Anolis carolinensis]